MENDWYEMLFLVSKSIQVMFTLPLLFNSLAEPVDELQKSYEQFLQRMNRKKKIQVVTSFFLCMLFWHLCYYCVVLGAFSVANLKKISYNIRK
jgi:hypothetical protein